MSLGNAKSKVSLSLSTDVLDVIDADVKAQGSTRSAIVEQWLRRAATQRAIHQVNEATVAYYKSMSAKDRAEDEAISRAFSKASKRVSYDDPPVKKAKAKTR